MNYKTHLNSADSLVTPYAETRAGFIAMALEKNRKATPFVEEAKALRVLAAQAASPGELLGMDEIQSSLLTAADISNKAANHLSDEDKTEAIKGLIDKFLEPVSEDFLDELIYRFLLIRGDSLGGSMRNLTVPIVKKNVDLCLFKATTTDLKLGRNKFSCHYQPETYLALGELKGGIAPAGADEHWKTANSALQKIRTAFATEELLPMTLFIGAAIESAMAVEIYQQLENNHLSNAANLTNDEQLFSICRWMLVTAGGMRLDYLITHTAEAHIGVIGGNALYAAVGAAVWDEQVGLWARIGDNYPLTQLQTLTGTNIRTDGLIRIPGRQDHRTFFAYDAVGNRDDTNPTAHFARIGRLLPEALADYVHSTPMQDEPHVYHPLALRPSDWPDVYDGVAAVHLSPLSLATHLHVPTLLRQRGVRQITLDPGERYMVPEWEHFIRQLLPQLDAFLPSSMEIRSLFGEGVDLGETAVALCQWGAPIVVIKDGANGALVCLGESVTRLPAYHGEGDGRVTDVTGAGDSFCGGFMVGLSQTNNPIQATHMGLISASLVIEGYGAKYALSRMGEAQRRLGNYIITQSLNYPIKQRLLLHLPVLFLREPVQRGRRGWCNLSPERQ
ncbi:MAG: hypothetical protein GY796_04170 [Chloroflexi bacterium]|nr:hypothetical protein [Chloroflexota bacterium]